MMDLVEEIESYSPQTPQNKPNLNLSDDQPAQKNKAPLIEPSMQSEKDKNQTNTKQEQPQGFTRFFKHKFYKQFFQVSEKDVVTRIKSSIIPPFKEQFLESIRPNPDFYGPFWIATTLVFLLGTVGNFSNYILSKFSDNQVWNDYFFKLELIRYAMITVYSFALGVPVTLYFLLKFMGSQKIPFSEFVCLYGYSLTCFIPSVILCILPFGALQWLLLIYSLVNSTLFLIVGLKKHIQGINVKHAVVFGVVIAFQLTLFLLCKLLFVNLLID